MNKKEFLEKFSKEVLQLDTTIDETTELLDLDAWDSLAQITTIAFLDKELQMKIKIDDVRNFDTVTDIFIMANINE